ncbi:MAG: CapA family protein [Clostridiales bacterium]|nr:CapA family protein [Clostridiales bacterium]
MAKKNSGLRVGGYIIRPLGLVLVGILVVALIAVGAMLIIQRVGSSYEPDIAVSKPTAAVTKTPDANPAAAGVTPAPTRAVTPTPAPTPIPTPALRQATIRSLGEIAVMSNLLQSAYTETDTTYDFEPMFEYIRDVVGNADFTVGNVEGPMDNRKESPFSGKDPMNTPPKMMLSMRKAGVDMLTLANDHALDMLFDGLLRTIENCKNADGEGGMKYVGAAASQAERDQPNIVEINGISVAFLNYTSTLNGREKAASSDAMKFGVNLVSKTNVKSDVKKAREAGADVVVAYASWGDMRSRKLAEDQEAMSKAMVAAGVDVIIGFNPHTVQPAYWLTGKRDDGTAQRTLCLFATGNFLSDIREQYFDSGVIFEFTIQETDGGKFEITSPAYIPTWVWRYKRESGSGYDYRVLAVGEWLDERPEGMSDADYTRLKAVWTEVQGTMSKGNADAKALAN